MKQVAAAVLLRDNQVLAARRPDGDHLAGKWEFPGGKIHPGETPKQCLAREMAEEFGICVVVGEFLGNSVHHYGHGTIELLAYFVDWVSGEMKLNAHAEVRWVLPPKLASLDWAPADVPIVQKVMNLLCP